MPNPTAGDLVNEVLGLLQGYSADSDQVTTLQSAIGPTDLTFKVTIVRSGAMGLSPGVVEIDSELFYISAVGSDGTATVEPWGRGYNSSVAASHAAGAKVTSFPTYPRVKVLDAINEAVARVFPSLFVPAVYATTTTYPQITYNLPDTAEWVLGARWLPPNGIGVWKSIRRSRTEQTLGQTPDLGVTVDIADTVLPGQPIEFTYAKRPTLLAAESDDFVAVTGLPVSTRDLIIWGAAGGDLVASQELSRLQTSSIEQQNRAGLVGPDSALTSSRYLEAKYQLRLREEIAALRRRYPVRLGRSWA